MKRRRGGNRGRRGAGVRLGRDVQVNASFTPWSQNRKAGEDGPRRLTRRKHEMRIVSIFLPLIVVILEVKVKIIRKSIIRKTR
jgi:hypothetical protein